MPERRFLLFLPVFAIFCVSPGDSEGEPEAGVCGERLAKFLARMFRRGKRGQDVFLIVMSKPNVDVT